jgi:hypothetical protein
MKHKKEARNTRQTAKHWRAICLAFQGLHDSRAQKIYDKHSCGYCGTEDCSCEGFSPTCDCQTCELVFNREEYGNVGISGTKLPTFKSLVHSYLISELE